MKQTLLICLLALASAANAQEGTSAVVTNQWVGPCCDTAGDPANPADAEYQIYSVKSFKKTTPVQLVIKAITVGSERQSVDFTFTQSIGSETGVLEVTSGVGVKLVLGQVQEHKRNKYVYKLILYKRDTSSNCWRPLSTFNSMYDVYAQTMSLGLMSVGVEGTDDFIRIEEGWMKLN